MNGAIVIGEEASFRKLGRNMAQSVETTAEKPERLPRIRARYSLSVFALIFRFFSAFDFL